MARGIIYCMTTSVNWLVIIGKSRIENFKRRMYMLESNGYNQVNGLKRRFAIEVDDYDEKENLLKEVFRKSMVGTSELFAVNEDIVVQLLSSFEGKQIYPEDISKEEVFTISADELEGNNNDKNIVPDGLYYIFEKIDGKQNIKAEMKVENGEFFVLKGSKCNEVNDKWTSETRRKANIENGILMEDTKCNSLSAAGWVILRI